MANNSQETNTTHSFANSPTNQVNLQKETPKKPKDKKPFYKKWWFWLIIVIIIASICAGTGDTDPSSSSDNSNKPTSSANESSVAENNVKEEPVITAISASYDGDTKEGIVIDSKSKKITVTATYNDGSTKEIKDWNVDNPSALVAGQTSSYTISYEGLTTELNIACSTMDASTYKEKCENISYEELSRNPSEYEGKLVTFTGKIIQVMEDSKQNTYRINVGYDEYLEDYYDDTILCSYSPTGSSRLLEDDIVTLYGVYKGLNTYESIFGENITIPLINAKYIER